MTETVEYLEGQPHGGSLKRAVATTIGQEATQVAAIRKYNADARVRDPSKIAWPSTLPIELALKTATPQELREHYGYTDEEWDALRENPVFMAELVQSCELVKQEGMSFRLKAKLQSEALLETSWCLIHAPSSEVPAAVKAKLMEATWRMAGFDVKEGNQGPANGLAIQINFTGGKSHGEAVIEGA
jgi:hypothetical protein